ncbi:ABC transporter substrate-binding protein [Rhodococcus sp. NPDC054953]
MSWPRRSVVALAAVVAVVSGCASTGDGAGDPAPTSGGAFPVTVPSGDGDVTLAERPDAIISLSPSATETLWAVGAGEQVVAVDDRSDHPAGVPTTDLSGFSPNVEAILGRNPDLVIASDDLGGLVSGLAAAGVPTLLLPAAQTLDDAYEQVERVGVATGHADEGRDLAASMREQIDAVVAATPRRDAPLRYFHELDDTLYTVTGDTFLGQVYGRFGLESIADGTAGDQYPQLSTEFVVAADPDLVFLADGQCCGVTPTTVAARPGWAGMRAVTTGQVHVLDEDLASRWGPRVVDLVREIGAVVSAQPVAAR